MVSADAFATKDPKTAPNKMLLQRSVQVLGYLALKLKGVPWLRERLNSHPPWFAWLL